MLSEQEILNFIQDDISSEKKRNAGIGLRYYEGKHDIEDYQLFYYDADGNLVPDKTRSNIKISHPFFTEQVDQEVQYMLSGGSDFIRSDDPVLQNHLNEYFNENEDFTSELYEVLTGAVVKGFEYMYAYQNADGKLAFQCADSMGVIEVESKFTSDKRDYYIYWYVERINTDKQRVKRIQVWDDEQTWYYTQIDDGKLILDESDPENGKFNPRPHVLYHKTNDDSTYYEGKGLEVIDLGVDVAAEDFVAAAKENGAKLICCSALLTTTMGEMKNVVDLCVKEGIRDKVKIMVGGAPITDAFCKEIGADAYTSDAASCAEVARAYFD